MYKCIILSAPMGDAQQFELRVQQKGIHELSSSFVLGLISRGIK